MLDRMIIDTNEWLCNTMRTLPYGDTEMLAVLTGLLGAALVGDVAEHSIINLEKKTAMVGKISLLMDDLIDKCKVHSLSEAEEGRQISAISNLGSAGKVLWIFSAAEELAASVESSAKRDLFSASILVAASIQLFACKIRSCLLFVTDGDFAATVEELCSQIEREAEEEKNHISRLCS